MFKIEVISENVSFQEIFVSSEGSLDSFSCADFYDFIIAENAKGFKRIILDFSKIDYITSAGLSVLIHLQNRFQSENSILILTGLNSEIQQMFHFFGLNKVFVTALSREGAEEILESMFFMKKTPSVEGKEVIARNRFIFEDVPEERNEPVFLRTESEKSGKEILAVSQTEVIQDAEEIRDEIPTLPLEEEKHISAGFSIPFITKNTDLQNEKIQDSILEDSSLKNEKFTQLVINCGNCGTRIRIKGQGKQKCPTCFSRFLLRQSGSISSIEKL